MLGSYPTAFTIEDALRAMRNFDIQDRRCIVTLKPTYLYICIYICIIHTIMHICAYTHIHLHIDICISMYIYVYVCMSMYVYIYTYIHTHVHAVSKPVHAHM